MTAVMGALSRSTLLHDLGYLEMGMQTSFESIVLGRRARRLRQGLSARDRRGRRGAGRGRDHRRRAGRQPPAPAVHAPALPEFWVPAPAGQGAARPLAELRRDHAQAARPGARRGAPGRAARASCSTRRRPRLSTHSGGRRALASEKTSPGAAPTPGVMSRRARTAGSCVFGPCLCVLMRGVRHRSVTSAGLGGFLALLLFMGL